MVTRVEPTVLITSVVAEEILAIVNRGNELYRKKGDIPNEEVKSFMKENLKLICRLISLPGIGAENLGVTLKLQGLIGD